MATAQLNGSAAAVMEIDGGEPGKGPTCKQISPQLRTAQDLFIRRWGEMGQTWGMNISRGNASMSLRALCDWGIIRRLHKRGERREYFESLHDVWEMFSIIAAERKRRELDPVLETIRQCKAMLDEQTLGRAVAKHESVAVTRERLAQMEEFMTVTNKIFQQFVGNAKSGLTRVVKVLLKAL